MSLPTDNVPPKIPSDDIFSAASIQSIKTEALVVNNVSINDTLVIEKIINGSLVITDALIEGAGTINGVVVERHASRHAFNGEDPLTPGILGDITEISTTSQEGTSSRIPRPDHVHTHGEQTGSFLHALATTVSNGFMSSSDFNLVQNLTGYNDPPESLGVPFPGSSTLFARSDHVHAHGNQSGGTLHAVATQLQNGFMSTEDYDKLLNLNPYDLPPNDVSENPNSGISPNYARADHEHVHGELGGGNLHQNATQEQNGFMSSEDKLKLDEFIPSDDDPQNVAEFSDKGTAPNYSRANHVHAHGELGEGIYHEDATITTSGFLNANEKKILNQLSVITPGNLGINGTLTVSNYSYLIIELTSVISTGVGITNLLDAYTTVENVGINLNSETGRITVDFDGVYKILMNPVLLSQSEDYCTFSIEIINDPGPVGSNGYSTYYSGGKTTCSLSTIISLTAGDSILPAITIFEGPGVSTSIDTRTFLTMYKIG